MKPPPFKDVNVLEIVLEILFMNPLIFSFLFFFFFRHKLFERNKNGEYTLNLENKIIFSYAHI